MLTLTILHTPHAVNIHFAVPVPATSSIRYIDNTIRTQKIKDSSDVVVESYFGINRVIFS